MRQVRGQARVLGRAFPDYGEVLSCATPVSGEFVAGTILRVSGFFPLIDCDIAGPGMILALPCTTTTMPGFHVGDKHTTLLSTSEPARPWLNGGCYDTHGPLRDRLPPLEAHHDASCTPTPKPMPTAAMQCHWQLSPTSTYRTKYPTLRSTLLVLARYWGFGDSRKYRSLQVRHLRLLGAPYLRVLAPYGAGLRIHLD